MQPPVESTAGAGDGHSCGQDRLCGQDRSRGQARPRGRRPGGRRGARRAAATGLLSLALAACAPGGEASGPADPAGMGSVRAGPDLVRAAALAPFDACPDVLRWFQEEALKRVGPYGLHPPMYAVAQGADTRGSAEATGAAPASGAAGERSAAAPSPGAAHSGTNVQEAGIDEPDVVKTDGRRLVALVDRRLRVLDVTGPPTLTATVDLPDDPEGRLLLQGDRLLVISSVSVATVGWGALEDRASSPAPASRPAAAAGPSTRLTLVDLADATRPVVRATVTLDGRFVDARLVAGRVHLVTTTPGGALPFVVPADASEAAARTAQRANEEVIRRSNVDDWLPHWRTSAETGGPGRRLVRCEQLRHPPAFGGFDTLAVVSLDLGGPTLAPTDSTGVTATGQTVYASARRLFVATTVLPDPDPPSSAPPGSAAPAATGPGGSSGTGASRTALHAFAIDGPAAAVYRASGVVEGSLLDQYSLSEQAGHLRVVTTIGTGCPGCAGRESRVSVLAERDGALSVVGAVGGLGRGEAVKAVRFVGDQAYVVTFRRIDPLYVVDLRDVTRPAVTGELKAPGYSAYLHPLGHGMVLGVGQDATEQGRALGVKVALFDLADPTAPRVLGHLVVPGATSEVERDPRAFLWWEPRRLALVPVTATSVGRPWAANRAEPSLVPRSPAEAVPGFSGTLAVQVGTEGLAERARLPQAPAGQPAPVVLRPVVVGGTLLTVSEQGVRAADLDTLAPTGWLPFA